jgi:tetratricopeptide (TPR) repeat protein
VDEAILEQSSSNSFAGPNDCTILDQRRDPGACRSVADATARGARGRANAQLLDGLALALQGNLDRAIDAFDRAVRSAPDASIGYLNRGLAYQAKDDLRRALADLNRAVFQESEGSPRLLSSQPATPRQRRRLGGGYRRKASD